MHPGEEAAAGAPGKPRGWVLWWVHLVIVAMLIGGGIAIVEGTPPDDGVNFAIVFTALPLLVLGLPWSLLQVLSTYAVEDFLFAHLPGPVAYVGLYVLADGPALLNVVVHAVVLIALRRRRRQRVQHLGEIRDA